MGPGLFLLARKKSRSSILIDLQAHASNCLSALCLTRKKIDRTQFIPKRENQIIGDTTLWFPGIHGTYFIAEMFLLILVVLQAQYQYCLFFKFSVYFVLGHPSLTLTI